MTQTDFNDVEWTQRLALALARLAEKQRPYVEELAEGRRRNTGVERDDLFSIRLPHPSDDLLPLYAKTSFSEGRYFERHYRSLRFALDEVRNVLGEHPVFQRVLDPSDERQKFWVQVANHGGRIGLLAIVGGLMGRAIEVPEDGFRVASSELNAQLNLSRDEPAMLPGVQNTGYHVALFHGLRFNEKMKITNEMTVVPFDQTRAFVNVNVFRDIAPDIIKYNNTKSVGAVLKPFRWKPEFLSSGKQWEPELDWAESFSGDAQAFVELLAVSHGAPVVYLMEIPHCIDRSTSYLLGEPHYHSSISWGRSANSFDRFLRTQDLRMDAFEEAKRVFQERNSSQFQKYAPVISRLAESLARSGRFKSEDRILDVAIALERMYGLDSGEITFKLKTRAACFLEHDTKGRMQVFKDVKDFYDARSDIVHDRQKKALVKQNIEAFDKGFEVARRSLFKLLHNGPPSDWNEMVIAAGDRATRPDPVAED